METAPKFARGRWKTLNARYDDALQRVPEALKQEGFGVITQIDMKETLKAKLGVDFRRYRIFGACNPSFAHAALEKDPSVGVLLPCNVVLYENDDGTATLGAVDPMETLGQSGAPALADLGHEVTRRLERFLAAMAS